MIGVLRWLPLSVALHSAALATTLLLPRERALLPLFVDLTLSPVPDEPRAAADAPSAARGAAASPRRQRAASGAGPAAQGPARNATSPPVASAPPAPPDSPPASEPPAGAPAAAAPPVAPPAVAAAPPRVEAPVAAAPSESSAPVATTTSPDGRASGPTVVPGGVGAPATAAIAGGDDGDARTETGALDGDAGRVSARGEAGTGGETLALAIPGDDGGAYAGYISLLRRRVQEALTYPSAARRRGMSGTVHLDIFVEPTGRIADVLVVRSSSHEMLDAAALDAVRALRPVPFPPGVRPRAVRVRLPVVFELR